MKYMSLIILALVTMACAVTEGLIEGPSPQFTQFTGLLTIVCTGVFIVAWLMMVNGESLRKD